LNVDRPADGYIMSSFGVGELGLHLLYETPDTIRVRRAALGHPAFARDLFGAGEDGLLPMMFSYDPQRTLIEVVGADADGYGRMTTSMLEPERMVPLLRYQTGDIIRLVDRARIAAVARRLGVSLDADRLPPVLVALRGREKEQLPNGSHVGVYKDALYADHRIARRLTGAFRVVFDGDRCTMHAQLTRSNLPHVSIEEAILRALPPPVRPSRLVLWSYAEFPFGMTLDYERKFVHYVPGGQDSGAACSERSAPEYVL
jgi:phenylacetate-CoA ligase